MDGTESGCHQVSLGHLYDGFESADLSSWSGLTTSRGESVSVESVDSHHGVYHGRFETSGSSSSRENAYLSENVDEGDVYVRGYFRFVDGAGSRVLSDNNDRFYLIRFSSGSGSVAWAGVRREGGVDKWTLYVSGALTSTEVPVSFDRWYCVELHWDGGSRRVEMFVDGVKILETAASGSDIGRVDMGVIYTYSVQSGLLVHGDCFTISNDYIGLE